MTDAHVRHRRGKRPPAMPGGKTPHEPPTCSIEKFLASPAASYATGIALPVDGGAVIGIGMQPLARGLGEVRTFTFTEGDVLPATADR